MTTLTVMCEDGNGYEVDLEEGSTAVLEHGDLVVSYADGARVVMCLNSPGVELSEKTETRA